MPVSANITIIHAVVRLFIDKLSFNKSFIANETILSKTDALFDIFLYGISLCFPFSISCFSFCLLITDKYL